MQKFVLSVLVENHAGVLSRVSGLFSRRGYNIDSLTVCETSDKAISFVYYNHYSPVKMGG